MFDFSDGVLRIDTGGGVDVGESDNEPRGKGVLLILPDESVCGKEVFNSGLGLLFDPLLEIGDFEALVDLEFFGLFDLEDLYFMSRSESGLSVAFKELYDPC